MHRNALGLITLTVFGLAFGVPRRSLGQQSSVPVVVREIASGVYHVGSSFFYMLAIRQGDSLIVVDLPDSEVRTRAMLDTLHGRFPTTPVRLAIVSHTHGDHVAGLGLMFARHVPVVTHAATRDSVRARGLPPGSSTASERDVRAVADSMTIGTGTNSVRVYAISNGHAPAMLLIYLPALKLLSAPDLAETGPWDMERAALVRHVGELHLDVERVAPGHNPVREWSDFAPAHPTGALAPPAH